jgi:hypothetical protein
LANGWITSCERCHTPAGWTGAEFELTYLSMRINGRLSHNWSLFGGFTHSYGDRVDSTLLDLGLRYAW